MPTLGSGLFGLPGGSGPEPNKFALPRQPFADGVEVVELQARAPLFIQGPRVKVPQQPQITANLLTTTLAVVLAQAPFKPVDLPNPVRTRQVQQPDPTNAILIEIVETLTPFQTPWVDQPRARRVQQPDVPPNLLPLSATPANPSARGSLSIQVQLKPALQQPDNRQNRLPLEPVVTANPSARGSLSIQVQLKPALQQPDNRQNRLPLEPVAEIPPKTNFDWINPTLTRKVQQTDFVNTTINLPTSEVPTSQKDWPNPIVAKRFQQTDFYNVTVNLPAAETPPPSQKDWPNPTLARRVQQTDFVNYTVNLPLGEVPPPTQKDFTNPVRARYVPQPDWLPDLVLTTLFVPPQPPPKTNFDWPNPTLVFVPQQDMSQGQNPDMMTPTAPVPPPVVDAPATPGRTLLPGRVLGRQWRGETEEERLKRWERDGLIPIVRHVDTSTPDLRVIEQATQRAIFEATKAKAEARLAQASRYDAIARQYQAEIDQAKAELAEQLRQRKMRALMRQLESLKAEAAQQAEAIRAQIEEEDVIYIASILANL